ncbi:DUF1697 domain-containing protein [Volucribacter amazonae]|uniref:DUF1697 domain-containing protein n=1 Tax=Volucribacter amazonae TaxID=256731 RepID=A0A9X4SIE4_9PAST|nr:DUF1697 domain-containing protein [Volucribacter amazonae]MDG6895572.1 hypothetical protein [Volucribacter amazonae]
MNKIVLLRGVMPTGKNSIPKMSYLVEILQDAGFRAVKTYIQSGNILLQSNQSDDEVKQIVHHVIEEKI